MDPLGLPCIATTVLQNIASLRSCQLKSCCYNASQMKWLEVAADKKSRPSASIGASGPKPRKRLDG
eukprot:869225-Amphidinium_carterae.1